MNIVHTLVRRHIDTPVNGIGMIRTCVPRGPRLGRRIRLSFAAAGDCPRWVSITSVMAWRLRRVDDVEQARELVRGMP